MVVKILVADEHEIFRKGVKGLLKESNDKFEIDEANNGQEVMEKIWKNNYDAVLLDISMPGRNGIDILKQLKGYKPDLQVLILSTYPEKQFAMRALKAGAAGFLTKAVKSDELVTAIQYLLKGKRYISSSLADTIVNYVEYGDEKAPHEVLSDREYEIMCMTAEGKTVKKIASELSLSDKTVSTYRARTLIKMNMNNTAQLIQYVINNSLINQNYE